MSITHDWLFKIVPPPRKAFVWLFLPLLLVLPHALCAQQQGSRPGDGLQTDAATHPEIRSFSGSPLLLDVHLPDALTDVESLELDTGSSLLHYQDLELPSDRTLTLAPFVSPGVYPMRATLRAAGRQLTASYRIGFVDFVWGRDNFRFGNNSDYESRIGDYSQVLKAWLEERFGAVSEVEHAVLVHLMYGMFGNNAGRCYAFSGSQLRYVRTPERLPHYYDSTYDVRKHLKRFQREMIYLQFDMAFNHFIAGPLGESTSGHTDIRAFLESEQGYLELLREIKDIRSRIERGFPVVTGYTASDLHHSMLAYGYIDDHARERIDLIVANNWKGKQGTNLRSVGAETIRVHLEEAHEGPRIEWLTREGSRDRMPSRLFVVPVKDAYEDDRATLEKLVDARIRRLRSAERTALVVENVETAWLRDDKGRLSGYKDGTTHRELEKVRFDRVQRSVIFEIPRDRSFVLELPDEEDARIYHVSPGTGERQPEVETYDTSELAEPSDPAARDEPRDEEDAQTDEPPVRSIELEL